MALAFQGVRKSLATEAQRLTLDLYRSLIKTARHFEKPREEFLVGTIRERFRFHRHETSRPRVLTLLREGNEALRILEEAPTNSLYMRRIDALVCAEAGPLKHVYQKLRRIPNLEKRASAALDIRSRTSKRRNTTKKDRVAGPAVVYELARIPETVKPYKPKPRKAPKMTKRKPYQIAKRVEWRHYKFVRVRGWRQPTRTAMMMKRRVKTIQRWVDQENAMDELCDLVRHEKVFYRELGVYENMYAYGEPLRAAREYFKTLRKGWQERAEGVS